MLLLLLFFPFTADQQVRRRCREWRGSGLNELRCDFRVAAAVSRGKTNCGCHFKAFRVINICMSMRVAGEGRIYHNMTALIFSFFAPSLPRHPPAPHTPPTMGKQVRAVAAHANNVVKLIEALK